MSQLKVIKGQCCQVTGNVDHCLSKTIEILHGPEIHNAQYDNFLSELREIFVCVCVVVGSSWVIGFSKPISSSPQLPNCPVSLLKDY